MSLVHSPHGSDEFNTWGRRLSPLSAADMKRGLDVCVREHVGKGKLDLPTFLNYCRKPKASHQPPPPKHWPRLTDARSLGNKRFQELHKVTMAMMREGPNGPITRATKDRVLTKSFVSGKTSQEIIDRCKELYGE